MPWVAVLPMSLAYSGSICATGPEPWVATCHASMNATKIATEITDARIVMEEVMTGLLCFVLQAKMHVAAPSPPCGERAS